jgi:hypothetical protein
LVQPARSDAIGAALVFLHLLEGDAECIGQLRRGTMSKALRRSDGTFAPGWRGGGRPPGRRNKLTEVVLQALADDFSVHGAAVIAKIRTEKPTVYLQVAASLCPKQVQTERLSPFSDISDEEMTQLEQLLSAVRARTVRELDELNGTAIELEPSDATQQDS